jgi:hypothetical protein
MTEPQTLGEYRDCCKVLFGEDSKAVKYLDDKIAEQGRDERVVAHPSQMLMLLASMHYGEAKEAT